MLDYMSMCCCDEHKPRKRLLEEENRLKAGDQPLDKSLSLTS